MTDSKAPRPDEIEVSLLGPGYGESVLIHLGDGDWLVVDSCVGADGRPVALQYLHRLGVNPASAVKMIVATHWHDDHIRGMSQLVKACSSARFCCASALGKKEFLSATAGLAQRDFSEVGYGAREIYSVFSHLGATDAVPIWASASRRVFRNDSSEVWSLCPGDELFELFLRSVGYLVSPEDGTARRIPTLSPNQLSVVLWVRYGDAIALLGGDLEKRGWTAILKDRTRPVRRASVFKVPHHGSKGAHLTEVWNRMLEPGPFAILAPWRRGGAVLPKPGDIRRILSLTPHAYASAKPNSSKVKRRGMVSRTIRGSGVRIRSAVDSAGMVRLRRAPEDGSSWSVELFDSACHLRELVA